MFVDRFRELFGCLNPRRLDNHLQRDPSLSIRLLHIDTKTGQTHTLPAALTPASVRAARERSTFFGSSALIAATAPALTSAWKRIPSIVLVDVGGASGEVADGFWLSYKDHQVFCKGFDGVDVHLHTVVP